MYDITNANNYSLEAVSPLRLRHLWIELTRKCNLECVHCYVGAGPDLPLRDSFESSDWVSLLESAYEQGCRSVQFIGGEPLLHPDLEHLLRRARTLGYQEIEVFTNATGLIQKWVQLFVDLDVKLALSFYGRSSEVHDSVTSVSGSYRRTLQAIDRAINASVDIRVGVIQIHQTDEEVEATKQFLTARGVKEVSGDRVRAVGRADSSSSFAQPLAQLTQLWAHARMERYA